jgi:hypothetical protein
VVTVIAESACRVFSASVTLFDSIAVSETVSTSLVMSVRTGAGEPKTGMSFVVESAVEVVAPSWVT